MKKLVGLGFLLLVAVLLCFCWGWFASRKPLFKAQCCFTIVDPTEGTNSGVGSYQDFRLVVSDGLRPFLPGGSRSEMLLKSYLQSNGDSSASGSAITNAFESAGYLIEESSKRAHLYVLAESEGLALDVANCILTNFIKSIEQEDLTRENKALAKLRWDIKKRKSIGEDVGGLLEEQERTLQLLKGQRRSVAVISKPSIVR